MLAGGGKEGGWGGQYSGGGCDTIDVRLASGMTSRNRLKERGRAALLLAVAALAGAGPKPAAPMKMNVATAMQVFEEKSLDLRSLKADIERSRARHSEIVVLPGPTLSMRGSWSDFRGSFSGFSGGGVPGNFGSLSAGPAQALGPPVNQEERSRFLTGSLSYLLFSGGKVESLRKSAAIGVTRSRLNYEKRRNELLLQVQESFYRVLQTQHQVDVATATVESLIELHKVTESLLNAGNVPKADLLRVDTDLANGRVQQVQAGNLHRVAVSSFLTLLNLPQNTELEWVEPEVTLLPVKEDLPALIEEAEARRQEPEMARLGIQAARAGVRAEQADYFPSLSVAGSYSWLDSKLFPGNTSWGVSASVSWTLFDSGFNAAQVRENEQAEVQSRLGLEQTRQAIEVEVTQAYLNLSATEAALDAAKSGLESGKESLRVSKLRYQNGYGTQLEVLDATAAESRAESTFYQAVYGYLTAAAAYRKALGLPLYEADSGG